jgi:phenylpyruvate tautomerase PptA (4-oxalocrotonate tautomerase family)
MPMIEVLYSEKQPLDTERKRAFARESERILNEVLGTPPGRMRLAFYHLQPEDSVEVLAQKDGASSGDR